MRVFEWLALGLIPTVPLALGTEGRSPVLVLLTSLPLGFLLQQLERFRLEVLCRGFDGPKRPALSFICKRARLCSPADAYAIYEVAFYRHPEWQAARDHVHRCWHWAVLLRSAAAACTLAALVIVAHPLASGQHALLREPLVARAILALLLVATSAAFWRKGRHTEALLHRFDCGWVATHWQEYERVAKALGIETLSGEETNTTHG